MNEEPGIYALFQRSTLRTYVGSAINLRRRMQVHKRLLKNGKHYNKFLQRTWTKYGEKDFSFLILENCERDLLIEREQWFLDGLKPEFNSCPIAGSTEGRVHSLETREKISRSLTGGTRSDETKVRMSRAQTGRTISDEHKANLSRSQIGRILSEETKEKMRGNTNCLGHKQSEKHKEAIRRGMNAYHAAKKKKQEEDN